MSDENYSEISSRCRNEVYKFLDNARQRLDFSRTASSQPELDEQKESMIRELQWLADDIQIRIRDIRNMN